MTVSGEVSFDRGEANGSIVCHSKCRAALKSQIVDFELGGSLYSC